MTTVLALGDSLTCGEGVGVRVPVERTWAALLAAALPGGRVEHLAGPGDRVRDVRDRQLPLAAGRPGDLATVLVGLNDVCRAGFDAAWVWADLLAVVAALRADGRTVLIGRLHDPTAVLPLPARLRRMARERLSAVNAAVDEAGTDPGVVRLDLAAVHALAAPAGLAVDRLHPSAAGHAAMALAAATALRDAGWVVDPPAAPLLERAPSARQRLVWLLAHGAPYLAGHLPELGRPALAGLLGRG